LSSSGPVLLSALGFLCWLSCSVARCFFCGVQSSAFSPWSCTCVCLFWSSFCGAVSVSCVAGDFARLLSGTGTLFRAWRISLFAAVTPLLSSRASSVMRSVSGSSVHSCVSLTFARTVDTPCYVL